MKPARLAVVCLCAALAAVYACANPSTPPLPHHPWWDDYPLIIETPKLAEALKYHATVAICGDHNDPTWGVYGEKVTEVPERGQRFHAAGLKTMSYFETFGQSVTYIAELGKRDDKDYTPIRATHWSWQTYHGGPIRWIGVQNYWGDEPFARPYTYTNPLYGSRRLTFPDGKIANGFDGDPGDPRNSRILSACSSKDILGRLEINYSFNKAVNAIDPKTGKPVGPLNGLIKIGNRYSGHISVGKDSACPYWADYTYASTLYAAKHGLDGMWTDNYSPWDSFGYPPLRAAFGDWSVARFRNYLESHFDPTQLKAMGVTDLARFDVRAALRSQARAWGGDDTNFRDPAWRDPRWVDNPLWRAYIIYKRQTGTQALDNYYAAVKRAGAKAGKPDFFVAGNDIPFFSLGWPRGDLDAVSTEMTAGWHMGTGARGILLPPVGRFGPVYKLAREHAKSRLVNVWMYVAKPYYGKPGIANVLDYEMLSHGALPKFEPRVPKFAGTPKSDAAFFAFVSKAKKYFGLRKPVEEIGVYYSSSSVLAFMTPGGFVNMNAQPHAFAFYGWATALDELHYQYRAVPEWKLTPQVLAGLRLLIIPNADVFDPADVRRTLAPWVKHGGRLIVTGNSGLRLGESGNFARNPGGLALAPLTGVSSMTPAPDQTLRKVGAGTVLYIPTNLGMEYYLQDKQRAELRPKLAKALNQVLAGQTNDLLIQAPTVATTVGLTLYRDKPQRRCFVDVNNCNIDLPADAIRPTGTLTFDVALPDWLATGNLRARVIAPGTLPTVKATQIGPNRAKVVLGPIQYYACVMLEVSHGETAKR